MHNFRQILPVVPGGNKAAVVSASVKSSENWEHFSTKSLTENMRVQRTLLTGEKHSEKQVKKLSKYAGWLLKVSDGEVVPAIEHTNIIEMPEKWYAKLRRSLKTRCTIILKQITTTNHTWLNAL